MLAPIIVIVVFGALIFVVSPFISRLHATLGIPQVVKSGALSFCQRTWLRALGLKTPILSIITAVWGIFLSNSDQLIGFPWNKVLSEQHATAVSLALMVLTMLAHVSGMEIAAATTPMISPLPKAIPAAKE